MSEIKITEAIEDTIKLQYAEEHKVAGSETWKSAEFLKFRQKQLNVLNEAFTDFLNKSGNDGSRFYDAQFQNEVYQNNMNKKFRKESGLNQPLWTRIANKVNLQNREAVGEWYEGYGGKFSRQKDNLFVKMADSIMKQAYSAAHLVEQVGARMTKYALSDNKEDFKKNPLKFVAKKIMVLPCGAVVRGGGAVLKTMTNPLYPIQSIKNNWQKRNNSEKHQSMVINHQAEPKNKNLEYKHKEVVKFNPNLSSSKGLEIDYSNNVKRKSDFKQRVAEIRQTEGVSVDMVKNLNETECVAVTQQVLLQKAVRDKLAIKR